MNFEINIKKKLNNPIYHYHIDQNNDNKKTFHFSKYRCAYTTFRGLPFYQ